MKNLFRKSLLIIGLAASFISCQTEDYSQPRDNDSNLQQSFEVQYVDWNHFKTKNKNIANKISSFNEDLVLTRQLSSSSHGFSIDETEVQIIEQSGFTTYTFPIHRDIMDVNTLENYVFKQDSTGNYGQYILTYQYNTDGDGNLICDTNYFDIEEISDDNLLLNRESCFPEFVQVGTETICDIRFYCTSDDKHEIGDDECNCGNDGTTCLPAGISCYDNPVFGWTTCPSGDEPNDNPDDSNTTGGGGTDNETTGNDETFVFSTPTRTKVEQRIENCLNNVDSNNNNETQILDPSYINLSSYNLSDVQKWHIYQYLNIENNCNDESKQFIIQALNAIESGGEADFQNGVILDSTFVNNVKLKCVYDKLTKDNNHLFRNTVGAFIDDPKFNLTFKVGNCVTTNDQCTDDSDPYNIVITFEDVSSNPIEIAQAILHESIHAEIARYVEQYQTGVNVNNREYLFQLYAYYKDWADNVDPNFNWSNAADHQFMIVNYIDNIAGALRQFDNYRFVSLDNYLDYAWDGLRNYGYNSGQLTEEEENYNVNLRTQQTNMNITVCND